MHNAQCTIALTGNDTKAQPNCALCIMHCALQGYSLADYPVCASQREAWAQSRPLAGLTVLDATPIFRNTLAKHCALMAAGAHLIVGRAEGFPCDDNIVALLRDAGVQVVSSRQAQSMDVDVVLDCAASFRHWHARVGVVELTRSGVPYYEASRQRVFVADGGRIKRIETMLGTGESYFRAMAALGYDSWQGRKLVIFGSGKVGIGLLTYAVRHGVRATVVTMPHTVTDVVRSMAAEVVDARDAAAVAQAVTDAYAVVTATGVANAAAHPLVTEALLHSQALLANMGVEDEYGAAMPRTRLLNDGNTLNFMLEEPTHMRYIDATLGLHNEGALYLLQHPDAQGMILPPTEMEERLLNITRTKGTIGEELNVI